MASPRRGPIGRLLSLAWDYRVVCLRVFAGQLGSLALGLGVLGGSGLAVDVVRRALDPAAPPVRWPLGLTPPATPRCWPRTAPTRARSGAPRASPSDQAGAAATTGGGPAGPEGVGA